MNDRIITAPLDGAIAEAKRLGYLLGFDMPIEHFIKPVDPADADHMIRSLKPEPWPANTRIVIGYVDYILEEFGLPKCFAAQIAEAFCEQAGLGEYHKHVMLLREYLDPVPSYGEPDRGEY